MATVNIRSDITDSFYRYKMPRIQSKIEGKGNGIKTVIPNMSAIGKSLARPPMYSTKFFGCELGAQVKFEEQKDRYIVNGAHDAGRLAELLDKFIKQFVLCSSCQNPETDMFIMRDQSIVLDCKACGARTDVDMRHKLVTYILKNPPPNSSKSGSGKKDRRAGKKSKRGKENVDDTAENSPAAGSEANSGEEGEDAVPEIQPSALAANGEDEEWSVDTSADAVAARMKELAVDVSKFEDEDGDEGTSKYDQFGEWLTANASASNDEIHAKAVEMDVGDKHKTIQVVVQVVFTENVLKQIPARAALITKFGTSEKHQRSLLGGIERLVGITHPQLLPKIPLILKLLYDDDLVEEENILKWGAKGSKKYVERDINKEIRKKAEPFLQWLQTADEDDSEDED